MVRGIAETGRDIETISGEEGGEMVGISEIGGQHWGVDWRGLLEGNVGGGILERNIKDWNWRQK